MPQSAVAHGVSSSTLSDVLERVLDKGVVIAGDIRVKIVDIELLTLQLRLVVCSVDKAREMGMDWWVNHPLFSRQPAPGALAAPPPAVLSDVNPLHSRADAAEDTVGDRAR
jgi:hypothetical protein